MERKGYSAIDIRWQPATPAHQVLDPFLCRMLLVKGVTAYIMSMIQNDIFDDKAYYILSILKLNYSFFMGGGQR